MRDGPYARAEIDRRVNNKKNEEMVNLNPNFWTLSYLKYTATLLESVFVIVRGFP